MNTVNYISRYGIHVFAYDPQAKPTAHTGSEGLSAGMTEFYAKRLLERSLPNLIFQQFGEKETIGRSQGKQIQWRKFLSYQKASTLVEGVTPDPENPVQEKITAAVIQVGAFTPYTDLVDLTHIDPIISELVDLHSEQAAITIDGLVRDELCTSTNILYAPIIDGDTTTPVTSRSNISSKAKITAALCAKAASILRKKNVPTIDGANYAMLVHPSVEHDLLTDPNWIDVQKYKNPENIYNGELGKLYKFRFFSSSQVRVTKDGANSAAVYDNIALGKNAFKVVDVAGGGIEMILKPITSGGADNPLNQRGSVGWKLAAFACKITYPDRVLRVVTGSSDSDIDTAN